MNKYKRILTLLLLIMSCFSVFAQLDTSSPRVKTANGVLEGLNKSGLKVFKGIPFAAPPISDLRWIEPQPVMNWEGVRKADKFGPRPMQESIFDDMVFLSDSISEDCLYLNIWTPAISGDEKLPVFVYFYGGGLIAGGGCEPRYAGANMARRGIISITVNYRLGIFGFFAHPKLTEESPNHSSGNYGYLDQNAALKWVKTNIAAFGGDPNQITVAGESAGSISVSAQMCSPLSKDLIAGVIASSGSLLGALPSVSLEEGESKGLQVSKNMGVKTLAGLRAIPAEELLEVKGRFSSGTIDGYFLPEAPIEIFKKGQQAKVPLLIGWNSKEMSYQFFMKKKEPTLANFKEAIKNSFGGKVGKICELYGVTNDASVIPSATSLASDLFIAFSTWKWSDIQVKTGDNHLVFRYLYCHPRPDLITRLNDEVIEDETSVNTTSKGRGAVHSADIEYAMGNLSTNRVYDWQPEDYSVSDIFQSYYVNFIKTGNPNNIGLPYWPAINSSDNVAPVLQIDENTYVKRDSLLEKRYEFLDEIYFPGKK